MSGMYISMDISLSQTNEEERPEEEEHEAPQKSKGHPIWARFKAAMEEHGGAQQYLLQTYPDTESQKRFAGALLDAFPRHEEVGYYHFKCCPPHDQPVRVHVSDLGFGESATTKPPPYRSTCLLIGEDIIKHSFQTEGAPPGGFVVTSSGRLQGSLCVGRPCGRLRG